MYLEKHCSSQIIVLYKIFLSTYLPCFFPGIFFCLNLTIFIWYSNWILLIWNKVLWKPNIIFSLSVWFCFKFKHLSFINQTFTFSLLQWSGKRKRLWAIAASSSQHSMGHFSVVFVKTKIFYGASTQNYKTVCIKWPMAPVFPNHCRCYPSPYLFLW